MRVLLRLKKVLASKLSSDEETGGFVFLEQQFVPSLVQQTEMFESQETEHQSRYSFKKKSTSTQMSLVESLLLMRTSSSRSLAFTCLYS